jgi:hypothetical protein
MVIFTAYIDLNDWNIKWIIDIYAGLMADLAYTMPASLPHISAA